MIEQACSSMVLVHVRKKNTKEYFLRHAFTNSPFAHICATKRVVQSILTTIRLQCRVINSNFQKHTNERLGHLSVSSRIGGYFVSNTHSTCTCTIFCIPFFFWDDHIAVHVGATISRYNTDTWYSISGQLMMTFDLHGSIDDDVDAE
jgi:hypothetical protein